MEQYNQFRQWLKQHEIMDQEKWLEQFVLAYNGDDHAMIQIALLYKQHEYFEEMYELLITASTHQNTDALYELANCYFESLAGKGSEQQAFLLYEKAARLGHSNAMNNLADMYLNGESTEVDEKKALYWFERAAELGVAEAMYTLGLMHEQGLGTSRDEALAFAYYHHSAKHDDIEAMYRLGMIFFSAELGQRQDEIEAVTWFLKASEHFHVDATFNLGYCYEHGCGVERQLEKAIHYYKQASMLGDREATKKVEQYYEQINKEQGKKWKKRLRHLGELNEDDNK